jgi:DNA-binding response OmpR family regulator
VRNTDESIVEALELGADDYVVKPYSTTQLVARVRAVLRRTGTAATPGLLETDGLALYRSRNEVQQAGGEPIRLTPLEVRLLEALMLNAGQVLPTDTLIDKVWGPEGGDRAMLKQLVYRLRTKLEPDAHNPFLIVNVPGVGYTLGDE